MHSYFRIPVPVMTSYTMTLTQLLTMMLMSPIHMGLSVPVLLECQETTTVGLVLLMMPTLDVSSIIHIPATTEC